MADNIPIKLGRVRFYLDQVYKKAKKTQNTELIVETESAIERVDFYSKKYKEVKKTLTGDALDHFLDLIEVFIDNLKDTITEIEKSYDNDNED
jgi:hypothetical protein